MGFTAINSSSPGPQTNGAPAAASQSANSGQQGTIASAYLGRGDPEVPPASVASKPPPKKAASKGKKRATTAPNPANSKKRMTSNVDEAMPASKARASPKKQTAKSTKDASKSPKKGSPTQAEAAPTAPSASVSVIAPSTSMGSLNTVSQQTSFEAVQSSSSRGTVLYNSFSSPTKSGGGVQISQPLLDRARAKRTSRTISGHETSETEKGDETFSDDDEDADFGALFDELAQEVGSKTRQDNVFTDHISTRRSTRSKTKQLRQESTAKVVSPTAHEDEVLEEDEDELIAALLHAERTAKTARPTKKNPQQAKIAAKKAKQLPTPATSPACSDAVDDGLNATTSTPASKIPCEEDNDAIMIDSDDEDEDTIELEKAMKEAEKEGLKPRLRKQNMRNVSQHEDYGGALLDDSEKQLLDKLKSATLTTEKKPIARSSFPQPMLDRSPIFGASNTTVLRTCFRLGEALNVGSQAVRTNKHVVLEIYARITSSFRDGRKQHFIFRDLYHDKPPHLEGDFALWSQSRLWELDGQAFLKAQEKAEGVMCRAVARMKRDGTKWRLEVLSIWEAGWDDVEAVAGIYQNGGVEDAIED